MMRPTWRSGLQPALRGTRGDQYPFTCSAFRAATGWPSRRGWRRVPDLAARRTPGAGQRRDSAERTGWRAHTVGGQAVREHPCPLRAPGRSGLRGARALEQLALLLISTRGLAAAGLQLLPAKPAPG
jgi:hypothetical protein